MALRGAVMWPKLRMTLKLMCLEAWSTVGEPARGWIVDGPAQFLGSPKSLARPVHKMDIPYVRSHIKISAQRDARPRLFSFL